MTCISGLVVEYIVAIDVTRVRFPADASFHNFHLRWLRAFFSANNVWRCNDIDAIIEPLFRRRSVGLLRSCCGASRLWFSPYPVPFRFCPDCQLCVVMFDEICTKTD